MNRLAVVFWAAILCGTNLAGQQSTNATPQTARQALMEMFFSKTPGTFVKHLPIATRGALEKSGRLAAIQQYSMLASQFGSQAKNLQTFETGSVLLVTEDPNTMQKVEITVENDALSGDQDDIELSIQTYKNGQPQKTPFMPRTTFSMKLEDGVWKLNEISVTIHLPLADPDFLKSMTEGLQAHTAGDGSIQSHPQIQRSGQTTGTDAQVVAAMRTILAAQTTYARTYKTVGYTCTLSELDGFGAGEPNAHQAMLINSGLASGKRFGYVFTLSECVGTPATTYHLTASPNPNYGQWAFCGDQTGVIRYSADGNPATCFSSGVPLQ
jgi:hypothetical protein